MKGIHIFPACKAFYHLVIKCVMCRIGSEKFPNDRMLKRTWFKSDGGSINLL